MVGAPSLFPSLPSALRSHVMSNVDVNSGVAVEDKGAPVRYKA